MLAAAGYRLHRARTLEGRRPLCCGRTLLSAGLVDEARAEARRTVATLAPYVAKGARVVGLEPSCLLTFRDEFTVLLPKAEVEDIAEAALLFEELIDADLESGRMSSALADQGGRRAHLHGHCHQKAAGVMGSVERVLRSVPGLDVTLIEFELLRHGRRVRLSDGARRDLEGHGRALPAARGTQSGVQRSYRRGRHELPTSDPRRHGPHGTPRGPCSRSGSPQLNLVSLLSPDSR